MKVLIFLFSFLFLLHSLQFTNAQCPDDVPVAIGGGYRHTLLLKNKRVYTSGENYAGQLGHGKAGPDGNVNQYESASANSNSRTFKIIDAGSGAHNLALGCDGYVYAWGKNNCGQLGDGKPTSCESTNAIYSISPIKVVAGATQTDNPNDSYLTNIKTIAAGDKSGYALLNSGKVVAWGENNFGQLGNGGTTNSSSPRYVLKSDGIPITNIISISAGDNSLLMLSDEGMVYTVGNNFKRIPTNDLYAYKITNKDNSPLPPINAIAAGDRFGLALANNGQVYAWGENEEGQLGQEDMISNLYPSKVKDVSGSGNLGNITAIAAGSTHALVLKDNGEVVSWGNNESSTGFSGQLGIGPSISTSTSIKNQTTPVLVLTPDNISLKGIKKISVGDDASFAFGDVKVYGWGSNKTGQLGFGHNNEVNYATEMSLQVLDDVYSGTSRAVCGDTVNLRGNINGNAPGDITWSGGAGAFSSNKSITPFYTRGPNETGPVVLKMTYQISAANAASAKSSEVTITFPPKVNAGTDQILCASTDLKISLAGTVTPNSSAVTWSSPTGGAFSAASSLQTTHAVTAADRQNKSVELILSAPYTNTACSTITDVVKITLNERPKVEITNPTIACGATTADLTANSIKAGSDAGLTYTYFKDNTGATPVLLPATVTVGTYYIKGNNGKCDSELKPVVVLSPLGGEPINFKLSSSQPTGCGASDGTITFSGLQNVKPYHLSYLKAGANVELQTPSDAQGRIVISSLPVGSYSAFKIKVGTDGCENLKDTTVMLSPPERPSKPSVISPLKYCSGEQKAPLSAIGQSLLWYTSTSTRGSAIPPLLSDVAGVYKYYVTQTANRCESEQAEIVVNINARPNFKVEPKDAASCEGTTGVLTFTGLTPETNYAVSFILRPNLLIEKNLSSNAQGSLEVGSLAAGTYSDFKVTSPAGCIGNVDNNYTLKSPPSLNLVINNPVIPCGQNTTDLTLLSVTAGSDEGMNFRYYTNPAGNDILNIPTATAKGEYYIQGSKGTCVSEVKKVTITTATQPDKPTVNTPVNYCVGQESNALSAEGTGLLWYRPGNTADGSTIAPKPDTRIVGEYKFYVSQTIGNCESELAEIIVNVNIGQSPAPTVQANQEFCVGAEGRVLTAAGQNLKWFSDPESGTPLAGSPNIETGQAGVFDYYVSQTIGSCESQRAKVTVTVNKTPSFTVIPNKLEDCKIQIGSIVLSDLDAGNYTVTYKNGAAQSHQIAVIAATNRTATIDKLNTGTYSNITVSNGKCAATDSNSYAISLSQAPAIPKVVSPLTYCVGEDAPLLTVSGNAENLVWYTSEDAAGQTTAPKPNTRVLGNTTYFVTQKVESCESERARIEVVVSSGPAFTVSSSPPTSCNSSDGSIVLGNLNPNARYGLSYKKGGTLVGPQNVTPNSNNNIPIGELGQGIYSEVTVSLGNCPRTDPLIHNFIVSGSTEPPVVTSPVTYCRNQSSKPLTAVGETLVWYESSESKIGSISPPVPSTANAVTKDYFVTQKKGGCESVRAVIKVVVQNAQQIFAGEDQKVCQNTKLINLSGSVNGGSGSLIWRSSGKGSFRPSNRDLATAYEFSPVDIASGKITLTLQSSEAASCSVADSLNITILDENISLVCDTFTSEIFSSRIVIFKLSALLQEEPSEDCKVNVIFPEAISAGENSYAVARSRSEGLNDPLPEDLHIKLPEPPFTLPVKLISFVF